jgi:hypothetical protein
MDSGYDALAQVLVAREEVGTSDGSLASESHQVAIDEHVHPLLFALVYATQANLAHSRGAGMRQMARAAGVNPSAIERALGR